MDNLKTGAFYWVKVNDPDSEGWELDKIPARYAGNGMWNYFGIEDESDWPPCWIGEEIIPKC